MFYSILCSYKSGKKILKYNTYEWLNGADIHSIERLEAVPLFVPTGFFLHFSHETVWSKPIYPSFSLLRLYFCVEIIDSHKAGRIGSMITVESGHSIGTSLAVLRMFQRLGVRVLTLTHNCDTPWYVTGVKDPDPFLCVLRIWIPLFHYKSRSVLSASMHAGTNYIILWIRSLSNSEKDVQDFANVVMST